MIAIFDREMTAAEENVGMLALDKMVWKDFVVDQT